MPYISGAKYLTKEGNISRIKDFFRENLFDDITCIPTKDYMKTPSDLYYGAEVSRYVKAIEDWENKIPQRTSEINFQMVQQYLKTAIQGIFRFS